MPGLCSYLAHLSNQAGAHLHDSAQHLIGTLPLKPIEDNDLLIRLESPVWLIRAPVTHDNVLAGDPELRRVKDPANVVGGLVE